ncbi:MAG: TMEM175 family protein [Candidatus Pacebacteria bacterium]|nr:TMEM175 family protein [Candidatus Paceibacterota bacterium]
MKAARLETLADGIFAIVMTILVFQIRPPVLVDPTNAKELAFAIKHMLPIFLSYLLSFSLLFSYWRAHHFFVSVYAKNIDVNLTNLNAIFFLFLALIPFSTSLLGEYSNNQFSIVIFGIHTVIMGFCLFAIRSYVFNSDHIKNIDVSRQEIRRGTVRTFVPVVFGLLAIVLSFFNNYLSLVLFTLAVIFNFSQTSTVFIDKFIKNL